MGTVRCERTTLPVMITMTLRRTLALGALGVLPLTGCGGNDDHESTTETVAVSADAIVVAVDADAAAPGTQTVPLGSTVSLQITSNVEHEFHLHGYDIEDEGTDVTMTFVASEAGAFEVEIHGDEKVIFNLVVEG